MSLTFWVDKPMGIEFNFIKSYSRIVKSFSKASKSFQGKQKETKLNPY